MNSRVIHRLLAAFVFLVSLVQFLITAQPSLSFWDPGELSAAAYMLQVPHPPGGPLFLIVGRLFYLLPIPGDPGFRMNCVSVVSSAVSVLLFYLIAVKIIRNYVRQEPAGISEMLGIFGVAAIGALTFSFSDTFWFNGVESNYFAASTLLFSLMVWLLMIWNEKADEPGSDKYLLLIAYLAGLSGGVHLMSVLTIVAAGYLVVFRRYVDDDSYAMRSGYLLLVHIALMLIVAAVMWNNQTSAQPPSPEDAQAFDKRFVIIMAVLSLLFIAVTRKKVVSTNSIYLPLAVGGVAMVCVYPGVIKLVPGFLLKIAGNDDVTGLMVLLAVLAVIGSVAYWATRNQRRILQLSAFSLMLVILGVTTYTMIVIRANDSPPMNENDPRNFSQLVSYLNREQYGDFPIFKRRWDAQPEKQVTFTQYSSDLDFFLRYQMGHMFNRYVFWNFIGRESFDQDAGVSWKGLFGIPFFVGLFGLYFHFRKDWRMASVFLLLFVFMGYLIAFYQNQQEPQPRDREYFYPGAYFVFALWVTLGIRGILEMLQEHLNEAHIRTATIGVLSCAVIIIPGRMLQVNYFTHDRSKNWVPWDYSYNILQTCEKNAVIFTNGDNDTFPLWFLQDVEGVRRDVRVVCLSLANTSWYVKQMKKTPYFPEAQAVAMSLPDAQLEKLSVVAWEPRKETIPVPPDVFRTFGVADTSIINRGGIDFTMNNTLQFGDTKAIRMQDIVVRDIIMSNGWKRPIYFAVTCSPDSKIGLDEYLWFEGLAWRLEPKKVTEQDQGVNPGFLATNLFNEPSGFSKTPQRGYKWRGLADPSVFFDENTTRLTINYRSAFINYSLYESNVAHDTARSIAALDRMEKVMPRSKIPMGWELESFVASIYFRLGQVATFNQLADEIEPVCRQLIESGQVNMNSYNNPYRALLEIYDERKEYAKTLELLTRLSTMYPNDPGIRQRMTEVQLALQHQVGDTAQTKTK